MGLLVPNRLDEVLGAAQEQVVLPETRTLTCFEIATVGQQRQHREQRLGCKLGLCAAANQLQRLHDELDLPDTAGPELEIVPEIAALHLGRDHRVHFPQGFEHAVVEVTPVNKGPYEPVEQFGVHVGIDGCANRIRLDIGIALPGPAMIQKIGLERGETRDRRAAVTEGPEARVYPEHEAVGRHRVEQRDDLLRQSREPGFRRYALTAGAFAIRFVQENQVDIR